MKNENLTPGEIVKDLANTAKVLSKPDDTTAAEKEAKENAAAEAQAKKTEEPKQTSLTPPAQQLRTRVNSDTKYMDILVNNLNLFKSLKVGTPDRAKALIKAVDVVHKHSKKAVLDEVKRFFVSNKNEEFLQPINALQCVGVADKSDAIRVRLLYETFYNIAHMKATRQNTSLEMIRSVFDDDFTSYVANCLVTRRK